MSQPLASSGVSASPPHFKRPAGSASWATLLERHLPGQAVALRPLQLQLQRLGRGLRLPQKPLLSCLLLGPEGCGQSLLVPLLAREGLGENASILPLHGERFQDEADALTYWLGSFHPAQPGHLARCLEQQPACLLWVTGFEQLPERVQQLLLTLLERGEALDRSGAPLRMEQGVLVIQQTSRLPGWSVLQGGLSASPLRIKLEQLTRAHAEQSLPPALLEMVDAVVCLPPFERGGLLSLAERILHEGLQQYLPQGPRLRVEGSALDWLAIQGVEPRRGMLPMKPVGQRALGLALTQAAEPLSTFEGGRLVATLEGLRLLPTKPVHRPVVVAMRSVEHSARALGLALTSARGRAEWLLQQGPALLASPSVEREGLAQVLLQEAEAGRPLKLERWQTWRQLELELLLREGERSPFRQLQQALERAEQSTPLREETVQALEEAIRAAEEALVGQAQEAPDENTPVWMVLSAVDARPQTCLWLVELARMQRLWWERLGLKGELVAGELLQDTPCRLIYRLEGEHLRRLTLEEGLHKLAQPVGESPQVQLQRIPLGEGLPRAAPPALSGERRVLELRATRVLRLELGVRRQRLELVGQDEERLARLGLDLEHAWEESMPVLSLARVYGEPGLGARDPRTGATVARMPDALEGRWEPLLDAWSG